MVRIAILDFTDNTTFSLIKNNLNQYINVQFNALIMILQGKNL